ncbi:MAG: hypothetical protein ACLQBC_18160 [Syntrophales bacterium]
MHMIGIIRSAVGYFSALFASSWRVKKIGDKRYYFKDTFYICSYLFIIAGIVVNILQVVLYVPIMEYMSKIFSSDFDVGIRDAYLLPSEEGGLPGIIKMFSYAPLSIYLMSLGLLNFINLDEVDTQRLKNLNRVALGAVIVKVFFSLDRLSIMAVLLANIFIGFKKSYMKNIRHWILMVLVFFLADYLSAKRLEELGIIDFILVYFKLGLVNFQLMIETCSGHTYGFSTILAPLYFIFKFFNMSLSDFESYYEWEWNSAQYFSSYAFQDFGYFYFVLFYAVGTLLYFVDIKTLKQKNIYSSSIYFIVLYGVISFLFVPAIRGIDFWFALLLSLFLINFFTKHLIVWY